MPIIVAPIKCQNFKWAKLKLWSLYQTACILSGVEPNPKPKTIHEETSAILDLMAGAIEEDVLWPVNKPQEESSFYPSEVVAWAKTIGIDVTTEFEMLIELYSERRPVENHHEDSRKLIVQAIKNRALRSKIELQQKLKLIAAPHRDPLEIPEDTVVLNKELKHQTIPIANKPEVENSALDMVDATSNQKVEPWLVHNPKDPIPMVAWYTPARYYARKLIEQDRTLLGKRVRLAEKVAVILPDSKIFGRGKEKHLQPSTILKAFVNVNLRK